MEGGGGRISVQRAIPAEKHLACGLFPCRRLRKQLDQSFCRKRHNVVLQGLHVGQVEFVAVLTSCGEHFSNAFETVWRRPFKAHWMWIIRRNHFVDRKSVV